jgi:hypothetical protein
MLPVIGKLMVGVRRRYHVFNAVFRGHLAHLNGHFPGPSAVVNLGKNMAVNVDHELGQMYHDAP